MEPKKKKWAIILFLLHHFILNACALECPSAIFAFGDSLTDTGNYCAAKPLGQAQNPPFGISYFHHPANRMSDGRLLIDFIAQAFGFPFLDPYLKDLNTNYQHGINFAFNGAEARSINFENEHLHLPVQLNQFQYFRSEALSAGAAKPGLPSPQSFGTALYFIYAGINDFFHAYQYANMNFDQLKTILAPQVAQSIGNAVQRIYNLGGRTFMVVNLPPIGCTPNILNKVTTTDPTIFDNIGCLKAHNSIMQTYAVLLMNQVNLARQHLPGITIMYADCYQAYVEAVTYPERYGFGRNSTKIACLREQEVCPNPGAYISWDGLHYAEAFNRFMAKSFLAGQHIDPPINLAATCHLDFHNF